MKYVAICGGLGNQMFQYAYLTYLKDFFCEDIRIFIPNKNWEHSGGFELHRVFGIEHTPGISEKFYGMGFPFTKIFSLLHPTYFGKNFIVSNNDLHPSSKYKYFYGTWQSEKYIINPDKIKNIFKFNPKETSLETQKIAEILKVKNIISVSVHIRRGDYLSTSFVEGFGKCCNIDYYNRAIKLFASKINNLRFVFFSDDMEWVKKNFTLRNAIYVDHNKGIDSWQDMYLMSLCDHNIIANSTFSWWGAFLNTNPSKMIIAPKRWWNTIENDDVIPEKWIRL